MASDDPVLPPVNSTTRMPVLSWPRRFGALDHRERHPVLVGTRRIEELEFDENVRCARRDHGCESNGWRLADGMENRGGDA